MLTIDATRRHKIEYLQDSLQVEKAEKIELNNQKVKTEQERQKLEEDNKAKQEQIDKLKSDLQAKIDARNASIAGQFSNAVYPTASAAAPDATGVIATIIKWANINGISSDWAVGIARCESGFNLYAHNPSGATGLFQFMPSTFYGNGGSDIYSAEDQSRVATTMLAHGQAHQWVCK